MRVAATTWLVEYMELLAQIILSYHLSQMPEDKLRNDIVKPLNSNL